MDITALFLGPKSENSETFKQFFDIIVEDTLNFRKNYHPDSPNLYSEKHKLDKSFLETKSEFIDRLKELLSNLRSHSVPTWDTSYIAHFRGDVLLPAVAGYIATIMYNPNNVTGESAPVTIKYELEFVSELCKMIGYPKFSPDSKINFPDQRYSWGHITSGGTVANIEGLWVARNLKYYPLSFKLAAIIEKVKYDFINNYKIEFFSKGKKKISELSFRELFNLSPELIYKLINDFRQIFKERYPNDLDLSSSIEKYSLKSLGILRIHELIKSISADKEILPLPFVIISQTAHYSWGKCLELLGLGISQLIKVPTKENFQLDINSELFKSYCENSEKPILAIIPIVGTTEEGVIDPVRKILDYKYNIESNYNKSFYIHADAAYGGFLSSMFVSENSKKFDNFQGSINEFKRSLVKSDENEIYGYTEEGFKIYLNDLNNVSEKMEPLFDNLTVLDQVDSITIDPHKLGYIPYSAGCILFQNTYAKHFMTFDAPYLEWGGDKDTGVERIFLAKTILEGSKPGTAAAACHLASKLVPLNISGYGKILIYTMISAQRFFKTITKYEYSGNLGIKIITLFEPVTNIICYFISIPGVIVEVKYLNMLNNEIYKHMTKRTSKKTGSYDYFISKTSLDYKIYYEQIGPLLVEAGISGDEINQLNDETDANLMILRSVFMNPLTPGLPKDYYFEFCRKINLIAEDVLIDILQDLVQQKFEGKRVNFLWIENRESVKKFKDQIELTGLGRYFTIDFIYEKESLADLFQKSIDKSQKITGDSEIVITDLCLDGRHHRDDTNINIEEININKVIPIIDKCYSEHKQIICYSRYLLKEYPIAKNIEENIIKELKEIHQVEDLPQLHFVGKTANYEILERTNFKDPKESEKMNSDMNSLMKKFILALQRIKKQ